MPMEPARPYLLTVYDPNQGRLLRLEEIPDEPTLTQRELEERDHYMRHAHVEVQAHWGRTPDEVRAEFERRSSGGGRASAAR